MGIERGEVKNLVSELGRLVKTGDYQGFLSALNYYQTMKEINQKVNNFLKNEVGDITLLADQDGYIHILRNK